jgi:3-phosphoshikimate 1-carboxyvinyltransferase
MPNGLQLELKGEPASKSYLDMTLAVLQDFGVKCTVSGNAIHVDHQLIIPKPYTVEGDWSSAAYWYGMASLFEEAQIGLPHLHEVSLQGDSLIRNLSQSWFGVTTSFDTQRAWISKSGIAQQEEMNLDMLSTPDLIPTVITLCCMHRIPFTITGTSTLRLKESDRAQALKDELGKLGHNLLVDDNSIACKSFGEVHKDAIQLNTYSDHRLAMCWAMMAAKNPNIWIENPACVQKSYPNYWNDLESVGFPLEYKK